MKIITPLTNAVSVKVKRWSEIKDEAKELRAFLGAEKFEGYWEKAFAISHVQVNPYYPKVFFVVHEKMRKAFGSWCVINLEIIKKDEAVTFPEACMSFPYRKEKRVDRWKNITVKYKVPFMGMLWPKTKKFDKLESFICQHEDDHARGKNMYGL